MNLEVVNTVVTNFAAVKMLLLILAIPDTLLKSAETTQEVDEIMKKYQFPQNNEEIKSMLYWTKDDGFKEEPAKKERNTIYIKKLKSLKKEFLDFYLNFLPFADTENIEYHRNCDIYTRVGK